MIHGNEAVNIYVTDEQVTCDLTGLFLVWVWEGEQVPWARHSCWSSAFFVFLPFKLVLL
jgi:hypothetical protein